AAAWAAAGAAVIFGLCSTLWSNTGENEVYTLHLFLLALILYLTLRWKETQDQRWLLAAVFLYGLAAGNHATVALYAPGFLVYYFISAKDNPWPRLGLIVFFFLVGFSVYLYLPLRSAANPPLDFGNPETWSRFLMHVTDTKDTPSHFQGVREGGRFLATALGFLKAAVPWWFWPLGLPLVLLGFNRLASTDKALAGCLAYFSLINILFFLKWQKVMSNFLPLYYWTALLAGLGAARVLEWRGRRDEGPSSRFRQPALAALLAAFFLFGAFRGCEVHNRSRIHLALESARSDFEALPPDSICLMMPLWAHYLAYQNVYRMRDDVTVMLQSDFSHPFYFEPVTAARFPRVKVPDLPYDANNGLDFLKEFLRLNLADGRDIYWEPTRYTDILYRNLMPGLDFLMKFTARPVEDLPREAVQAAFDRLHRKLFREIDSEGMIEEGWLNGYYTSNFFHLSRYLSLHGRHTDSVSLLLLLEQLFGPQGDGSIRTEDLASINNEIGLNYYALDRLDEATARAEKAVRLDPALPEAWYNLGLYYRKAGRLEKAAAALEQSLRLDPDSHLANYHLAETYADLGRKAQAAACYRRALPAAKGSEMEGVIRKKIEALREGTAP
ncbi:MAG: DUF2723 domain-containing protein, partial [Thermodesulfobacteriota bacterium]